MHAEPCAKMSYSNSKDSSSSNSNSNSDDWRSGKTGYPSLNWILHQLSSAHLSFIIPRILVPDYMVIHPLLGPHSG